MPTTAETVHVIVGWNDDYEQHYVYLDNKDASDSESKMFGCDVPADLWAEYERASAAAEAAAKAVIAATDVDDDAARLRTCCAQWRGDLTPAQKWWNVALASAGEDEWPARDTTFGPLHKSEAEAQAYIDELPESFYVVASVCPVVTVTKDRLSITTSGYGPFASACYDCGWDREAHAA